MPPVRSAAIAALVAAPSFVLAACILAQSPVEQPLPAITAPVVLDNSVVPSPTTVLLEWPDEFVIPVYDAHPSLTGLSGAFFLDAQNDNPLAQTAEIPSSAFDGGIDVISVQTALLALPGAGCHRLVYQLIDDGTSDGGILASNAPEANLAQVVWQYSPTGNLSICTFDAGNGGAVILLDAGSP